MRKTLRPDGETQWQSRNIESALTTEHSDTRWSDASVSSTSFGSSFSKVSISAAASVICSAAPLGLADLSDC